MLGEEDKDRLSAAGAARRRFLRSVSWTDRSPTKPNSANSNNPRPQTNSKARSFLPPLSITRHRAEEWPRAGSDDLGIWPNPQTPRGSVNAAEKPNNSEQSGREFQFKRDKLAFFDKECSRIADHIYLGSDAVAKNREVLSQNGITHVLNCVGFVCPEYFKVDLVYKTLWLQDSPSEDITSILYDVFDYFEDVREQGGRVLVHCCQGVSRSTSLVIAYLMWREGQSFEDAFQYVKAARGVTNPNMGFACQLLQCQKRVHAVPASPNSMLRMYRMAPHSPYDPLHLVPKTVSHPGVQALDSRGAFVVHVPSALYVWNGRVCNPVMSNNARAAACQVIRYERAKGPIVNIKEGEEPAEFWEALAAKAEVRKEEAGSPGIDKVAADVCTGVGERKVDEYDLDFEIFRKALAGGVVPPFSVSNSGSETCLPARENGWSRLRRKIAKGVMKEFVSSSKLNPKATSSGDLSDMAIDGRKEGEQPVSDIDPSSPLSPPAHVCGSPDSFECFPNGSPDRIPGTFKQAEHSDHSPNPLSPRSCGSPDSFSCFLDNSSKFSSKSPTISPSTSEYASSFAFSPSSSNWSDLSYLSSRQPSPSGLDSTDPLANKNISFLNNFFMLNKETAPTPPAEFYVNHNFRSQTAGLPCKGITPSIAERRGSNPPPRMLLPTVDEPPLVPRNLVRSWSFSTPDIDDDDMKDSDYSPSENEGNREEVMLDADIFDPRDEPGSEIQEKEEVPLSGEIISEAAVAMNPVLYKWPSLSKVEVADVNELDSGSAYILLAQDASLDRTCSRTLTFWLGRDTLHQKGRNHGDTLESGDLLCQRIAHDVLGQKDLPLNTPVQVVREGEEPEQFLNHLRCIALKATDDTGHG